LAIPLTIGKQDANHSLMTLTLDKMSRLVVPKALRDRFGLQPGDDLEITLEEDGIMRRPIHPVAALGVESGVMVCSSEVPVAAWDIPAFMEKQRDQRSRDLGGI
jgi:AbrB family looped-hinge helix DNA binding protein